MEESIMTAGADEKARALGYGILQLAYIGDAVMELYVREYLLSRGNFPTGKLSKMAKAFVSCEAQSDAAARIEAEFTEEEASVFRRGRNAKTKHTPSHGEVIQYKRATGLEALFGYLYLTSRDARARGGRRGRPRRGADRSLRRGRACGARRRCARFQMPARYGN